MMEEFILEGLLEEFLDVRDSKDAIISEILDCLIGRTVSSVKKLSSGTTLWVVTGRIDLGDITKYPQPLIIQSSLSALSMELIEKKIVANDLPIGRRLTTEEVSSFFRSRAIHLDKEETENFPKSWAPAARSSFSLVPIGGDTREPVRRTRDILWKQSCYYWYDLEEIEVGDSIYRISCQDTLWLFTRQEDGWEISCIPEVEWPQAVGWDGKSRNLEDVLVGAYKALRVLAR